jgi:HicB family
MARKPTDTVQLKLRFPEALRRRLVREATRRGQSLNGYIVRILEEAFQQSDSVQQRAQAIAEALGDEIVDAIVEEAKKAEWEAAREMADYDEWSDSQRERNDK